MSGFDPLFISFAAALGTGLLIGAERERRKGEGPQRGALGVRTFALASLAGAISFTIGGAALLALAAGGLLILGALAYWRAPAEDPGVTTETALFVTVLLGGLAMTRPALAAGVAVATAILLSARTPLHRFTRAVLTEGEIKDALTLAAATLIVLPLLPDEQMGPYGALNPRSIWIIVILVMAIGALGHVAIRAMGAGVGLPLAGFASGFISSTATTAAMGAKARREPRFLRPAAAGAILSAVSAIIELAIVLAATNFAALRAVAAPLAWAGAAAILYALIFSVRALREDASGVEERGRAFSIWTALVFAAVLAGVSLLSNAMAEWFGPSGAAAAAALAGFANTSAAAVSMAALSGSGTLSAQDTVFPILAALSANAITRAIVAMAAGSRGFAARVITGLILTIAAAWAGWRIGLP
jgi:uncharacterized membrane protein (DUF4010 family)